MSNQIVFKSGVQCIEHFHVDLLQWMYDNKLVSQQTYDKCWNDIGITDGSEPQFEPDFDRMEIVINAFLSKNKNLYIIPKFDEKSDDASLIYYLIKGVVKSE